ncbi:hypothetical protein EW145_g5002 [Phellinidium pouzarii]|uniref:NCA2-domain-containing protein n=1 Tax=Phellinidium pouzarii TaxID=167371 RepID=A0A4S4L1R0_9AGAM|nr:hypothetical protein EW145_g5002 [Phellinidium pouzarii]
MIMSSFATNHVRSLVNTAGARTVSSTDSDSAAVSAQSRQSSQSEELHTLLLQLKSPFDKYTLRTTLQALNDQELARVSVSPSKLSLSGEDADNSMRVTLENRIIVGIYAEALDLWLKEASEADSEAEWWAGIARSQQSVAWYLLATLPERLRRSFYAILNALRSHHIPLRPSSFTPQTLRQLFPHSLRPTALATAFFPHLSHQPHLLFTSPLELARQECELRKEKLIFLRDERAGRLGQLLSIKSEMERSMRDERLKVTAKRLQRAIDDKSDGVDSIDTSSDSSVSLLHYLTFHQLPVHVSAHAELLSSLRRPSRLTLLWPHLALIPPLSFVAFRLVYGSRESIAETALRIHDTIKGFWFGYVIEPMKSILDTVRTGRDNAARIVSREGVRADIESLERMSIALSRDKLSLDNVELQRLVDQIRQGDLTPVLRIYEEDIKSPVRAALTGSLIRSLLIQIQKAKVDLDQALSGIDRLLHSQELTFAFVGVAPALAIVYAFVNVIRGIWIGGRGDKMLGGRKEREGSWLAIRHVERLILTNPGSSSSPSHIAEHKSESESTLPPLTSGLLLISLARLRAYAEVRLPVHSLIREGILGDIGDLENPTLGRTEKLRVVERMWRSWGTVLGWDRIGRFK